MNRFVFPLLGLLVLGSGCVSKKKYAAIQASNETLNNKLDECNRGLDACRGEKSVLDARLAGLESSNQHLKDQVRELNNTNAALLNNVGNMATLSAKEAENLEKSLEQIREQDLRIRTLHDALSKKDSVTLALVVSLKSSLGNLNDTDVVVNVEKSVVFISLSDKMLFSSGSTQLSARAKEVLGKVATVVNDKPEMEILVEGHTDNVPIKRDCFKDNWDLSASRATTIARILQTDFQVAPSRITAGARSEYVPLATNETAEGRSTNRRIRIVILPKLDQFYNMIESGLKQASGE
ncbi:MAG: OmpA family protein [Flavobacteriales bacterium]|jgi:chemotaxis protein MotB|nr:OmpA family protein [Flavobacteriales bacterium]MBK6883797.1 OmpA family protein [Flavobacteriales bacterium]MBK7100189.1 OmpA family protein [Flavobacteriales bacterium]MBK7481377.1 OmpA family protein [Flavobacteriales bacterium]MBK9628400.1 OmpA family protein [Flavobacteriales bacterium]